MQLLTCENHPQVKTRRKCYSCAKAICSACIIKVSRHLFCSKKCHRKYLLILLPKNSLKRARKRIRRRIKKVFRKLSPKFIVQILIIATLVGALVVPVFRMKRLEKRLLRLSKSIPAQIHVNNGSLNGKHLTSNLHEKAFNIIAPANGGTIMEKTFRI